LVHLVKVRSDAARNRARILEAARDLVAKQGPDAATDDIAAAAGVAVGTLYRHFPTKAALVEAVVGDSLELLATAVEDALARVDAGAPAADELELLFRVIAERHSVDASVKEAALALGARAWGADGSLDVVPGSVEERAWDGVLRLLAAAVADGAVRPDLTGTDLFALVSGVPREPASTETRERYIEIVLDGVRRTA
jgi:AcrR family transcriptional regulator